MHISANIFTCTSLGFRVAIVARADLSRKYVIVKWHKEAIVSRMFNLREIDFKFDLYEKYVAKSIFLSATWDFSDIIASQHTIMGADLSWISALYHWP